MAAHRYWRVNITATNGTPAPSCAELLLREVSGGANVASGATAIAESSLGAPYTPDKIGDGNPASFWVSGTNGQLPDWIGYDLGAGNAKDIKEIVWTSRGDSFGVTEALKDATVQYSDNGTSWADAWWIIGQTGWSSSGTTRTFTMPSAAATTHRFWRAHITQTYDASGYVSASEIEFYNASNLPTVNGSTSGVVSSGYVETVPTNAFDGNTATRYSSAQSMPQWIGKDFGAGNEKQIRKITWANRADNFYSQAPKAGAVQFSDDGISWATYWEFSEPSAWTAYATRSYQDPTWSGSAPAGRPHVFICT